MGRTTCTEPQCLYKVTFCLNFTSTKIAVLMSAVMGTSNLTSIFRNFVRFAWLDEAGSLSSFITRRHIPKDNNFEISNLSASFYRLWSGGVGGSPHFIRL